LRGAIRSAPALVPSPEAVRGILEGPGVAEGAAVVLDVVGCQTPEAPAPIDAPELDDADEMPAVVHEPLPGTEGLLEVIARSPVVHHDRLPLPVIWSSRPCAHHRRPAAPRVQPPATSARQWQPWKMDEQEHDAHGQDAPIEDGHDDASDAEKIAGLAEQMRQDVAAGNVTDVEDALRQRLDDAGLELGEEEFAALLASVRG
jgi:hypothetical protein